LIVSDATENLKTHLALTRARLELLKAKKMSGGYSRHPSGSSKGGQFAPKGTNSFGNPSEPAPFKSGGNTFLEVGGPGWGSYKKPSAPPPGAKPHPAGVDDKGSPVTVNYPTKPSSKDTWGNKNATATFTPGGDTPSTLNGVPMKSWSPPKEGWHAVGGNNERLEALFPFTKPTDGKSTGAGVLIMESDGRVWLTKPTNEFGGYKQTYPKGTVESGLTMQQNAIKEAFEETGLKIKITGVLGDYDRTTSRARMYIAERVGGTPKDMGWESQAVRLATMKDAKTLLNMSHDKKILDDLQDLMEFAKAKGGSWQNQPRWPGGTPLGGQWKTMGADGLTMPPLIAGGLEGKNTAYQKAVNAAHAAAQKGDVAPAKMLVSKYISKLDAFNKGEKGSSHLKWGAQGAQYGIQLLLDVGAKGKAAATADRIKGPEKLSDMGPVTGAKPGGSNPGALYTQDGQQWLVKGSNAAKYQDATTVADRSKNEVLAAKLMLAAGAGAPDMKLVELEGKYEGGLGVASKMIDGLTKLSVTDLGAMGAVRGDFAIHAWLANYDVLGAALENTAIKDGKAVNIDPGGALLFRAQGEKKDLSATGGLLDPSAPEFESMRKTNDHQKAVYGKMMASDLAASAEKLNNISDDTIKSLVKTYGPGDEAFRDKLAQNLIDRKNAILDKAGLPFKMGVSVAQPVQQSSVELSSIKTSAVAPTLSKTAFSGDNKLFYQQYDPQVAVTAGTTTAFGQPPTPQAKATAEMILAAQKAGFKPKKFKVGGLQQAYVYVKDGNVLTENGAKALVAGAAISTAAPAAPKAAATKQDVEAQLLASAMKTTDTITKLVKNQIAAGENPPEFPKSTALAQVFTGDAKLKVIAEAIDKASLSGDLAAVAMAKVGLDKMQQQVDPDASFIASDIGALKAQSIAVMEKLAYDAIKASEVIASSAPKIDIPPKPEFPSPKFGGTYYKALAEKAEGLAAKGDLAGLKAMATSGKYAGGVPWKPGSPNGKVMAAYHGALVAKLEQQDASVVVARVKQAQVALDKPAAVPTPTAAAEKALPAMPDFAKEYYAQTNVNAPSHNKKVAVIEQLATAGDVKGLISLNYATNTMGKAQAKLANNVLAALGSTHIVTPGQKANTHPALFGGTTANEATAAAAKVNVALPSSHAAAKPTKPVNADLLPPEPKFITSNAAVKLENEGHAAVLTKLAKEGDLSGLKAYNKFSQQSEKLTSYKQGLIESVEEQVFGAMEKRGLNSAPPISKIAGWVLLGKTDPATIEKAFENGWSPDPLPSSLVSAHTKIALAVTETQKDDILRYVGSWSYGANDRMRNKGQIDEEIRSVSKSVSEVAIPLPAGTRLKRNMSLEGSGLKALLAAQAGDIIQSPQFESTANPTGHYGEGSKNVRLNLITAPGVRGIYVGKELGLKGENEMILPENTRYAIRRVYKKGSKTIVEAVILPSILGQLE